MRSMKVVLSILLCLVWFPVQAELPDFKSLVKDAAPAVVNISTVPKEKSAQASTLNPFEGPDAEQIPEMFRHFFKQLPELGEQPRQTPRSLGSGFVISDDGYILTNHHVVKGAGKVLVRLSDRRELEAQVIGSDERADVAVLKIDATGLPAVRIGSSDALEAGEWVLAIGSPFGFDHSVTAGIVSATERALANETYVPFIQTDVAINPGNSGGPLFNLNGEVVGINSQIYTRSGGFMGLSFAIPIDVAMDVAEQLKTQGHVTRGWLGVIIQEVSRDLAESFGLDKPAGALIAKVLPGSPAEKAGFMEGDVIYRFDGRDIDLSSDLPPQVGRVKPGETVPISIVRNGKHEQLDVTIEALPENSDQLAASGHGEELKSNRLDLVVGELDPERKEKWNLRSGVVIRVVNPGAGADAGLVAEDVITMVNGEVIESVEQFEQALENLPVDRPVPLRIVRRGSPMFIPLKLEG
ncbi:DegQ family serine endoprotease [Marinobacterium rhizophilum]|uniref:Probable periplasmic serine endoprotease DegP-like n=1 Tax=Marinobacterium rhizophilum TaxID=420402 RepID=A0ABY5HHH3_9GAMM|nr:DegQ family serine endoprotease [Marinobacterium rhizophilum]UTW11803.1 DegQ family serine endoprotease [Marinobacterium rhizophilum]